MKELICIVCPKGCHLKVDENNDYSVSGAACKRGIEYAKAELTSPTRVLTSTVIIKGAVCPRLPVKTDRAIAKNKILEVMQSINNIKVWSPICVGEILAENICDTGANIVATRNL